MRIAEVIETFDAKLYNAVERGRRSCGRKRKRSPRIVACSST